MVISRKTHTNTVYFADISPIVTKRGKNSYTYKFAKKNGTDKRRKVSGNH
jgi:hypothetical protein